MSLWRRPRIILSKLGLAEHICVFLCVCVLKGVLSFLPQVKDPPSPKTIKEKKKNSKAPSVYHFYLKKRNMWVHK